MAAIVLGVIGGAWLLNKIRTKNKELNDLKAQYRQRVQEIMKQYSEDIEKQQERMQQINKEHKENLKRVEAEKSKEIAALEEENAKNLNRMELSELRTRLGTQLQSVKQLDRVYEQLLRDCQEHGKECSQLYQQTEKEILHLKTRFKEEGEDKNMIRLILYGQSGHGKSTLGNRLCNDTSDEGDKGPFITGGDPESVTQEIKKHCIEKNSLYKYGLSITDQPGTEDTQGNDRLHANKLVQYLRGIEHINAIGLVKAYRPPRLEASHQSMIQALEDMLGDGMWKHVVIILTNTPANIQDTEAFRDYCQKFRATVRKQLELDEQNAPLPIISVELHNLENCRKQLSRFVNETLASLPKFHCENLKSPLENLLTEKEQKITEFEPNFRELLNFEEFLANWDNTIDQTEQEIAKRDHQYRPIYQKVSRNLSEKIKREWDKTNSENNNGNYDYDYNGVNNNSEEKAHDDGYSNESNCNMNSVSMEMKADDSTWPCFDCTYPNQPSSKNYEVCDQPGSIE